ncbi:parkin coregulated gene protein-like [Centruroides vittatus]|uniref:parkin coregulated gene protein-like n=1 Tax=Centruroides vittatus TaxID=120091 RepID=UPI0035105CED
MGRKFSEWFYNLIISCFMLFYWQNTLFNFLKTNANIQIPLFRERYCSGEIPVTIVKENSGWNLYWKAPIKDIDIGYYLPIFFEVLRETVEPFNLIANMGLHEMLDALEAQDASHFLDGVISHLINGLTSNNPSVVFRSLMALQHLYNVAELSLNYFCIRILIEFCLH